MNRKLYEDNAGGLKMVGYDDNGEAIFAAWGLDMADSGTGIEDMTDEDDWYRDATNWADADGSSDSDLTLDDVTKIYDTTELIAEYDGRTLTIHVHLLGHAGSKYLDIDRT